METKAEREARGRPVGRDVPYAAMGGLTGFSSLADGYLRLDDSGAGETSRLHHRLTDKRQSQDELQQRHPSLSNESNFSLRYEISSCYP